MSSNSLINLPIFADEMCQSNPVVFEMIFNPSIFNMSSFLVNLSKQLNWQPHYRRSHSFSIDCVDVQINPLTLRSQIPVRYDLMITNLMSSMLPPRSTTVLSVLAHVHIQWKNLKQISLY